MNSVQTSDGEAVELKVFRLNEKRYLENSSAKEFFSAAVEDESVYWIDIERPDPEGLREFLSPLSLHPLVPEGCLDPTAVSLIAPYEKSLLIKLPAGLDWKALSPSLLSIICLPQAIITLHASPVPALEGMIADFSTAVKFHTLNASNILYQLLDHLVDEDMALVLASRREIESLDEVMDRDLKIMDIGQILALKRKAAHLAITFEEQHHCMTSLESIESEAFDITDLREYFRDSLTHLEYALRSIGRQQAHLSELHQHYLLTLQEKTNKRLRLLTILSAVFMPLTLIAGIYGMNFRHMPELGWPYAYPLVIAIMLLLSGMLLWIFYRKGWFK